MSDVYDRLAQWMRDNPEANVFIHEYTKPLRWTCALTDCVKKGGAKSSLIRDDAIKAALDEWEETP